MTSLSHLPGDRSSPPSLASDCIITDGQWHKIGFAWDGSNRMLYIDNVEVAKDALDGLASSTGGFHIGTGKAMEPETYFSGLIDDVRIYNRVASP